MLTSKLIIKNGTLESLKWFALIVMTLDHINKYFYGDKITYLFQLGRIAMPLFGFVLAYNLARPNAMTNDLYVRAMKNLAIYGVLATPFFILSGGLLFGWWPLNILFTLFVATGVCYLTEKGGNKNIAAAIALFLIGGAFVEFWYFGLAFIFEAWRYCKSGRKEPLILMILSAAALYVVNTNFWAMAALPIIFLAPLIDMNVPRIKRIFYAYYPAHLAIIAFLVNFKF